MSIPTDEVIRTVALEHIALDERDLVTRKSLIELQLKDPDVSAATKNILDKFLTQLQSVIDHGAGEGVIVWLDERGRVQSSVSHGRSKYSYITNLDSDDNLRVGTNYVDLLVDLMCSVKDGDITLVELFYRRNWSFGVGDPWLDQPDLTYRVKDQTWKAKDKDALAMLIDSDGLDIDTYMDLLVSTEIVPDVVVDGVGNNTLVYQDQLTKVVTSVNFSSLEDVLDLIFQNILIKLEIK